MNFEEKLEIFSEKICSRIFAHITNDVKKLRRIILLFEKNLFSNPKNAIFGQNFKIFENLRIMKNLSSRLTIWNPKAESENFSSFSQYSQSKQGGSRADA